MIPHQTTDYDDNAHDKATLVVQRAKAAARSTWISVAVNLLLTIAQIAAGILTRSQGLIADGIHSLSDLVADFVVLLANHHSGKAADTEHPYGHQRFETAASLVLGALLLAVGIGMLWSAFLKIESPHSVPTVHLAALWVALGALAAELGIHVLAVGDEGPLIAAGATDAGGTGEYLADVNALTNRLRALVRPGDIVVVKASRGLALERVADALAAATDEGDPA